VPIISELIKKGRAVKNMTQQELADAVQVSKQAISQFENGHSQPRELILDRLYEVLDLTSVSQALEEAGTAYNRNDRMQSVPIYDIEFSAGQMLKLIESRDNQYPIGFLNIPEVSGCDAIIRAKGDGMEPRIMDGDWLGIKKHDDWKAWLPLGYIYAIDTNNFQLVKYIKKGSTPETFTIVSENKQYEDDEIPKDKINEVWAVKAILPFSRIETLI
jgi:transcriptional regulator with XRE-family HTH domain